MKLQNSNSTDTESDGWRWIDSPIGPILLRARGEKVTGVFLQDQQYFPEHFPSIDLSAVTQRPSHVLLQLEKELQEYFSGHRESFETEFLLIGTAFQIEVWQQLGAIPFGGTTTYGQIAHQIGKSNASRAVGAAIGRNPLSIVLPCHRVIGKSGALTGYAGGLDRKRWLLDFERGESKSSMFQQSLAFA
ncbi:MAG: methylated-DNA--[protein]-cysteine S-methyltransferase [Pirellula sp.]|jgi:methylated-DNA-[protein]-cysteine S-methyltransferase|nr:methylated-DNA--[protein]-cysteine S-methyltransferase [Pirellula sp.]